MTPERGSCPPDASPILLWPSALLLAATLLGVLLGVLLSEWHSPLRGAQQRLLDLHSTPRPSCPHPPPLTSPEQLSAQLTVTNAQGLSAPVPAPVHPPPTPESPRLAPLSNLRGYAAVLYSGTARSFSAVFISHLLHLICSSPLTVHLFFTVMALDNSSEHLSVASTLGRYDACQNPDGDWLSIEGAVKGWRLQRQADVDFEAELPDLVATYRAAQSGWQEHALKLYWAQHAVDDLRRAYEEREGIAYSWVSRQRLDVALATDVWQSLYHVTPLWDYLLPGGGDDHAAREAYARLLKLELRAQHLPDHRMAVERVGGDQERVRSYLVGDLVFTPRLSSHLVHLPGCSGYGGLNDQFAIGSGEVMRPYFQRALPPYLNRTRQIVARVPGVAWFQTETFLGQSLQANNIQTQPMPDLCFQLLYSHHSNEPPTRQNGHIRAPTECSVAPHGRDCCAQACAGVNSRRDPFSHTIRQLSTASADAFTAHARALHGLALRLANLSGFADSEVWRATLNETAGAAAQLQATADRLHRQRHRLRLPLRLHPHRLLHRPHPSLDPRVPAGDGAERRGGGSVTCRAALRPLLQLDRPRPSPGAGCVAGRQLDGLGAAAAVAR